MFKYVSVCMNTSLKLIYVGAYNVRRLICLGISMIVCVYITFMLVCVDGYRLYVLIIDDFRKLQAKII